MRLKLTITVMSIPEWARDAGGGFQQVLNLANTSRMVLTCAGSASPAEVSSPDSANSQFFICFDDARFLDKQYTAWGKVIEGMENVDKIKRGEPVQNPDKIKSLKVAADVK